MRPLPLLRSTAEIGVHGQAGEAGEVDFLLGKVVFQRGEALLLRLELHFSDVSPMICPLSTRQKPNSVYTAGPTLVDTLRKACE